MARRRRKPFSVPDNEPVPTTIQTNTLKTTAKQLCASLEDEGVTVEPHPWLADCFTVSGTGDLEGLRAWQRGLDSRCRMPRRS